MSSDEDFSLVRMLQPSEETLAGINNLISNYKKQHYQLIQEQKELLASREDQQELTQQFRRRTEKLVQMQAADQQTYSQLISVEKEGLRVLKQEEKDLRMEVQRVQEALKEADTRNVHLRQQTDTFAAVPEREIVFKGEMEKADAAKMFDMTSHIVYPMDGGTALVTFEEEAVAKRVLSMKSHRVDVGGDCSIRVDVRPVRLMLPSLVEVKSEVCPRRILISNLPKMNSESLLELEIHFSKSKNGGGEVEKCELLVDSGTVVLTYLDKSIAKGVTDAEHHTVTLQQKKHRVRATPFLNGKITHLKTQMSVCPCTLLLTGIPDISDQENLQDLLEIHFQKSSNGGGEIKTVVYNRPGQHTLALFDDSSPDAR